MIRVLAVLTAITGALAPLSMVSAAYAEDEGTTMVAEATQGESSNAGQAVSDAGITTKVKAKLLADKGTQGLKINVDTEGGVVTLSGTVKSNEEKSLAEKIATGTEGVQRVDNRLVVKTS